MRKFESINQFRQIIKHVTATTRFDCLDADGNPVYDHTKKLPVLKYKGTVKLHGTSAAIHFSPNTDEAKFQSRNNEITPLDDNAGFAFAMSNKPIEHLRVGFDASDDVYIYGEWCGGNIQKNVAICQLEKMFVVFDVIVNGERILDISHIKLPEHRIFNINDFPTYYMDIDFNAPEGAQNKLVEITLAVEKECPVGAAFGISDIGEGLVWSLNETVDKCKAKDPGFTFKVKGSEHSVSKVKTLAAIDIEKVASINDFVSNVVTENRCNQGIEFLKEMKLEINIKNTGQFNKWVYGDVIKEESDVIVGSGLEPKDVGGAINKAAKNWFFEYLNKGGN